MTDDNDMKIAGKSTITLPEDYFSEEQEIKRQDSLGNIDKARLLGIELANLVIDYECDIADLEIEDNTMKLHTKILFAFIVFTSLWSVHSRRFSS